LDLIGSIRFVSSSTGSQVFSSNYVPYGPQYGASGTPDEFLYAGKIYDGSTGFYYFGARYYDPTIGRFVTQDSYSGVRADPQSLNRYVYARDNPMKFIDPNGHLYVGRYLDDGYSRDYYLAKLPAPSAQSTPSCTSSPDVCLTRGGNSQYTPIPVSGSPDRFLTIWGNNQYTPLSQPPPASSAISSFSAPSQGTPDVIAPVLKITTREEGALAVVVLLGVLGGAAYLGSYAAPLVPFVGKPLSGTLAGAGTGLVSGSVNAGIYVYNYGPNATPEGAFNAAGNSPINGPVIGFLRWFFER